MRATMTKQPSRFNMTLREALEIQARQVAHYQKSYDGNLGERVAVLTVDLKEYDLDAPMPVSEVNELVPRGGVIEWIVQEQRDERKRHK